MNRVLFKSAVTACLAIFIFIFSNPLFAKGKKDLGELTNIDADGSNNTSSALQEAAAESDAELELTQEELPPEEPPARVQL